MKEAVNDMLASLIQTLRSSSPPVLQGQVAIRGPSCHVVRGCGEQCPGLLPTAVLRLSSLAWCAFGLRYKCTVLLNQCPHPLDISIA